MLLTTRGLGRPALGVVTSGLGRYRLPVTASYVMRGGSWIPLAALYVHHGGQWRLILEAHDPDPDNRGSWRRAL